ncbi:MAG: HDIG domain-containing protein [Corallococcus sp.]|nr:HDIG domain-containing protein [Corallococcus sp.]
MTKRLKVPKNLYSNIAIFAVIYVLFAAMILLTNIDVLTWQSSLIMLACLLIFIGSVGFYVYYADKDVAYNTRKVATLCATMLLCYVLIWVCDVPLGIVEVAPLALCSLILSQLVSNKSSFFTNFVVVMLYFLQNLCFSSESAAFGNENCFILFAGITTAVFMSYVLGTFNRRFVYIIVGIALGLITALCRLIVFLLLGSTLDWLWFYPHLLWSFAGGIVSITLMFLLLPLLERIFNVVSPFRFSEIATTNTELMRKLYEKAPGTFSHSLAVANYVEACAAAVGENPFLARAVAYYHDIGKLKNPKYFTENQTDGVNPHDQITPEASVSMIKSHTVNGLALARQYKLPVEIQRAIVEHHGTMPIKYFYVKAQKYTDGVLPYADYSYDGPKPTSKISAILMICDACEAALRASGNKNKAESIVDGIVAERMTFNQFSECDITMKEIDIIKSTIITTFVGIKHTRVKYPDVKLEADK